MKKNIIFLFIFFLFGYMNAQTSDQLIGRWQLIKWTKKNKEKKVADSTFQVFKNNKEFISITEGKSHKGKWKLWKDNTVLTIMSGIFVVDFKVDYFDSKKRIITADGVGTLEYIKVN